MLKRMKRILLTFALMLCMIGAGKMQARAAASDAVFIQMPGFVVEQWSAPRAMYVYRNANVYTLPAMQAKQLGAVSAGQYVNAWGQTDTGWYFIECAGSIGYVRYENAVFVSELQAQQNAEVAQQQAAMAAQQAALAAQQQALIAQQAAVAQQQTAAAGIVFIGDSRMVTLKEAVENNLGACPAAVVAKNSSRYEWLHDTGIPQADKIIGKGTKVVINMGVNDLSHADLYVQDVNAWAAVWIARGATVYYASVNPVYANSHGMTEEKVSAFNTKLHAQLIPQIIWLDSNNYLKQHGVHSNDGIHYKDDTNLILFNYYMTMIGAI